MMSEYPVTLALPAHIYDRLRQAAEQTNQPIERVLIEHLEESFAPPLPALPPDEQAELDALNHLSDDALLTIAHEQMQEDRQLRLKELMERNNLGTISSQERAELTLLVEQGQQLMLRKAKALALLTERGHPIRLEDPASD